MADKIRVLLTEEEVNKKISEVAAQINKDYEGNHNHEGCCQAVKLTSRLFLSSDNQITPS